MLPRVFLGILLLAGNAWAQEGSTPPPAARSTDLDDAGRERFLREAKVTRVRAAPGGITASRKATLRLGEMEHDAHIQTVDEAKSVQTLSSGGEIDFRDSYKNNLAAYNLDRLLGLGMVPVTVLRDHDNKRAAFTWWVDDVKMDEFSRLEKKISTPDADAWNCQMYVVRLFDQLIYNFDRNLHNLLIDADWRIWMIDHTRAFKIFGDLKNAKNLAPRCPRGLLAGLRRLDMGTLKPAMAGLLTDAQINGLLKRRDLIVARYDKLLAAQGEEGVLYELPARVMGAAQRD